MVPAQVQHLQDVVVDCTIAKQKTSKLNGGGKCEEMFTFNILCLLIRVILFFANKVQEWGVGGVGGWGGGGVSK